MASSYVFWAITTVAYCVIKGIGRKHHSMLLSSSPTTKQFTLFFRTLTKQRQRPKVLNMLSMRRFLLLVLSVFLHNVESIHLLDVIFFSYSIYPFPTSVSSLIRSQRKDFTCVFLRSYCNTKAARFVMRYLGYIDHDYIEVAAYSNQADSVYSTK